MPNFDAVIRNGTVADGSGGELRDADIGIVDGRIAAMGRIEGRGAEEIDARGMLVTPGFVDVHTHLDGQAAWDDRMAPVSWHGVTTAVMGNCGVGFAPARPSERERLIDLMEGVEDIPGVCLAEGLDWNWESFGEYMDVLDRRPRDIDICALLPHAPLRVFVMGERALNHEPSTEDDNAGMRRLTIEAMKAGALGFSTSRTAGHKTLAGKITPTLKASERELAAIASGMTEAGHGVLEVISDWDDPEAEFAMLRRVAQASGRRALVSVTERYHQPEVWKQVMAMARAASMDGIPMHSVVAPRPIGVLFGLEGTQNPFSGTKTYREIMHLPLDARVKAMRDPDIRRRIVSEDPLEFSTFALLPRLAPDKIFRFGSPPDYAPRPEHSVAAMAAQTGRSTADITYDLLLEEEGKALLFAPIVNYMHYTLDTCRAMLSDDNALFGLGDGGAHVGFITDSSFPSYLLAHWARDAGAFPLTDVVRRLSARNAHAIGLHDRGVLAPGMKADINVIDLDRLTLAKPYLVHDLPAGGTRLLQRAEGWKATFVSGQCTYRDGVEQAALPGRLVRGPQSAAA
ncbi:amidohydrolase family protein [Sphingobium sp.]|uniref:N-acyl-D-amino-acid deacylase family protein n=1 Tax=Sphingobium sp. TaxID=1912891 RepID=UPI0028BDCF23|nr:amidohydrolase family protein [Sphingobium sp.]